ncbi:cytochrome P450 [Stereum hirsutum FP-91666 SS1]|uniref:cytochrome P450 n=1 Tax=Stereum hirsutum (strain FP-91666) TaxID=721885 RepID=UPI000444A05E|nr:cytochrome P450 [Stereum hirsutum FP-91666 SS1]EIM81797.1 cytochrome P450 [Stereum hirsutum FP-91666 SS1]
MNFVPSVPWLAIAALASPLLALVYNWRQSEGRRTPSGPPSRPIVGNILTIPRRGAWNLFAKLHNQFGDLIFFHGLGRSVLVLNKLSVINDLFDKRGDNYSHRPVLAVLGGLMGLDQSMTMLPYGREWREQRRLAHVGLNATVVKKYHTTQEDLASIMLLDMLNTPEKFFDHVRLYAERIILSVTYGLPIDVADNEYVTQAEETMHIISDAMVPGAFLCDLLPWMKWLPSWVPFQREAAHGRAMIEHLVTKPFEHVKQDMSQGAAAPSLTQDLLALSDDNAQLFESRVKWATGSMYGGASTYATVLTFMMAMALNPEKQKRAQAEVDNIVGSDRMPAISDIAQMPYVNLVIKETLRWHPSLPLGIARRTDHDDFYEGYFIPKGTVVLPNVWSISQKQNEKYDPTMFIPERFLDPSEEITDPFTYVFGFGRRVCPGKALAENSLFAAIAGILSVFDISEVAPGELVPQFGPSLVSYPEPFKCNIKPRSPAKASLIERRTGQ